MRQLIIKNYIKYKIEDKNLNFEMSILKVKFEQNNLIKFYLKFTFLKKVYLSLFYF